MVYTAVMIGVLGRPIIGITSYLAPARWGAWDKPAARVPQGYVAAVAAPGGRAVLLPPSLDSVDATLARLDGLIFYGGPDITLADRDTSEEASADSLERERDAAEMVLLGAALAHDLPLLGICRGMQLINLIFGGTMIRHLPDVVGHDGHRRRAGHFDLHLVEINPTSTVGRILGKHVVVHSSHHQGVDELGAELVVSARASDGAVEAIEDPTRRSAVGVLWHPEEGDDRRPFAALVRAARPATDAGEPVAEVAW